MRPDPARPAPADPAAPAAVAPLRAGADGEPRVPAAAPAPAAPGAPAPAGASPAETLGLRVGPLSRLLHDHPRWVDGLIAGLYLTVSVASFLLERFLGAPRPGSELVLTAVFTVLVLARRRLAVPGAVVVALAVPLNRLREAGLERNGLSEDLLQRAGPIDLGVTVTAYDLGTLALLLYAAAVYRPPRAAWAAFTVAVAAVAASILTFTDPWAWWPELIASTAVLLVAVVVGLQIRTRRRRLAELEDRARRLALERDQREQLAVAGERARIAREMHDVLAHSLSVMVALADGASAALVRNPDAARRALAELTATGRAALADTRRMVGVLRAAPGDSDAGAPLAPQPGAGEVAALVERFRLAGLPVRLTESGPPLPADAALQLAVYRIVQECLTNVLRYAPRTTGIDVVLTRDRGRVVIEVDNDAGAAGAPAAGSGQGLIGIRERAAVFGGTVEAGPTARGWQVRALLGWEASE